MNLASKSPSHQQTLESQLSDGSLSTTSSGGSSSGYGSCGGSVHPSYDPSGGVAVAGNSKPLTMSENIPSSFSTTSLIVALPPLQPPPVPHVSCVLATPDSHPNNSIDLLNPVNIGHDDCTKNMLANDDDIVREGMNGKAVTDALDQGSDKQKAGNASEILPKFTVEGRQNV